MEGEFRTFPEGAELATRPTIGVLVDPRRGALGFALETTDRRSIEKVLEARAMELVAAEAGDGWILWPGPLAAQGLALGAQTVFGGWQTVMLRLVPSGFARASTDTDTLRSALEDFGELDPLVGELHLWWEP